MTTRPDAATDPCTAAALEDRRKQTAKKGSHAHLTDHLSTTLCPPLHRPLLLGPAPSEAEE